MNSALSQKKSEYIHIKIEPVTVGADETENVSLLDQIYEEEKSRTYCTYVQCTTTSAPAVTVYAEIEICLGTVWMLPGGLGDNSATQSK